MKKIIIFGIIFISLIGLVIAGIGFSDHEKDKDKCNIDHSWCKVEHVCPSEDAFCQDKQKYKNYVVFLTCEFYTGKYSEKKGYCDFYNKKYIRSYPFDIDKYSTPNRDQFEESIKKDIKVIIDTEQTEAYKSYNDKSRYKDGKYNRKGDKYFQKE